MKIVKIILIISTFLTAIFYYGLVNLENKFKFEIELGKLNVMTESELSKTQKKSSLIEIYKLEKIFIKKIEVSKLYFNISRIFTLIVFLLFIVIKINQLAQS